MPKPLPLLAMKEQSVPRWVRSAGLSTKGWNSTSVLPVAVLGGEDKCHLVPYAAKPGASVPLRRFAAVPLQLPPTCRVGISFTTTLVGTEGVSVLEMRSFTTESETRAFGVTAQ